MKIHELVVEMKMLERRLTLYEEKYGILSQDFYDALMNGQLGRYDEYDETRTDFSRWKGIYETWRRRKQKYDAQIKGQDIADEMAEFLQTLHQEYARFQARSGAHLLGVVEWAVLITVSRSGGRMR